MEINYNKLGKRIRTLRKAKALSQEKLAENASISNNYLSNIENNYSIPSLETLLKICSALDTTPNELLLGIDTSKEDYLLKDINEKIKNCNQKQRALIDGFIDLIINND